MSSEPQPGPRGTALFHHYRLFGLVLRSEIELPELDPVREGARAKADITILIDRLPAIEGERHDGFAIAKEGAILNVPGAARYLISGGDRIAVDPDPLGSERHMRLYLLGSAIGALLHQRALLPLHANAIGIAANRAVAFLGPSGAGKSTMAAWFHDRGYRVLADDVCVVTIDPAAGPMAHPGIPRLRLWRDALEATGRDAADHDLSFDDAEKYNVPTRSGGGERLKLAAAYLLGAPEPENSCFAIDPLAGLDAVEALVANTYRGGYIPMLEGEAAHLAACLAIARAIPVFRVRRVWGKAGFEDQMERLAAHVEALAAT